MQNIMKIFWVSEEKYEKNWTKVTPKWPCSEKATFHVNFFVIVRVIAKISMQYFEKKKYYSQEIENNIQNAPSIQKNSHQRITYSGT